MTEFWETSFKDKQTMWGFEPAVAEASGARGGLRRQRRGRARGAAGRKVRGHGRQLDEAAGQQHLAVVSLYAFLWIFQKNSLASQEPLVSTLMSSISTVEYPSVIPRCYRAPPCVFLQVSSPKRRRQTSGVMFAMPSAQCLW